MVSIAAFVWAAAGLILIGAEFLIPGFVIFFFGVGALITAVLTGVIPGLAGQLALQALIWLGSTGLFAGLLRKLLQKVFYGTRIEGGVGKNTIGRPATVTEQITPDRPGRIKFQGTTWKAISYTETFNPGDTVEIIEQKNLTFTVTRSLLGEPEET